MIDFFPVIQSIGIEIAVYLGLDNGIFWLLCSRSQRFITSISHFQDNSSFDVEIITKTITIRSFHLVFVLVVFLMDAVCDIYRRQDITDYSVKYSVHTLKKKITQSHV